MSPRTPTVTPRVVAEAIARALPAIADRPAASLVPLLRLLDELLAATDGDLPADARPTVEALSQSGGQAGRLARSILARDRVELEIGRE